MVKICFICNGDPTIFGYLLWIVAGMSWSWPKYMRQLCVDDDGKGGVVGLS